ncbi:PqqD family protein [uncultured Desulfovibrio sp.]|uniref:PqqD family protein n=1 Tax=uncultured Desulfovibrio sp. TaxID=167968 RepID=UPI002805CEC8|nr:PqqD family protein [uncultured Desulfovibrio sp.]
MATYVLNEAKMFSDIADGIAIVINSETGIYYGMNGLGTAIFENLLNGAGSEKIVAALTALPGAPEDIAVRFQAFLDKLLAYGVLIEGAADACEVRLNIESPAEDDFTPTVEEFDDAQEMLLADPIHEVKEMEGWQPKKAALETDLDVVREKESKMQK